MIRIENCNFHHADTGISAPKGVEMQVKGTRIWGVRKAVDIRSTFDDAMQLLAKADLPADVREELLNLGDAAQLKQFADQQANDAFISRLADKATIYSAAIGPIIAVLSQQ